MTGNFLEIRDFTKLYNINNYSGIYSVYNNNLVTNRKIVTNNLDDNNTIVILGDSFARPVASFLSTNFKSVIILDQRYIDSNKIVNFLDTNADEIDVVINLNYINSLSNYKLFNYFNQ